MKVQKRPLVIQQNVQHTVKSLGILSMFFIIIPAFIISLFNMHNTYDDAFITYRYAYNLAIGHGFVYNIGEWFMGTTAPFYGLLLGIMGILEPSSIPSISGYLSGISLILAGLALYWYGRLHNETFCGLLAGLFFVVNPLLPSTFGGEMLFQTALILWAFVLYKQERSLLAALLLALAILTRADGVIATGVIGLHYLVVQRRFPWREMLCIAVVLLPFLLLAWLFYGSPLPGTLEAKLAQRDSGLWPLFTAGMIEWIKGYTMQGSSVIYPTLPAAPHAIRFILFGLLGLPALFLFRFWLLPLAWIVLYALGYHILNVPFYHWYVVPVATGLMILAASGVAGMVVVLSKIYQRMHNAEQVSIVRQGLIVLCLVVLSPGIYAQIPYAQYLAAQEPNPVERLYEQTGRWLATNTARDARVGYFEIGYLGYYSRRTIIDPLGLVNPGLAVHIAQHNFTWAYEHYRPEYIIHNQLVFAPYIGQVIDQTWFKQEYREIARMSSVVDDYPPLIIYQRQTVE